MRALHVLREARPDLDWDPGRVLRIAAFYESRVDIEQEAVRCATWMTSPECRRAKDGPQTFYGFCERAAQNRKGSPGAYLAYDRTLSGG